MPNSNIDFSLPLNAYAGFDALTIRSLLIDRLKTSDVFKDANFEGSNLSAMLDVIAYSNHLLLFYLNNTSSEANFSYASLYENVNRLSKILNYNPTGFQTSVLNFSATAGAAIPPGSYAIPRFSYITNNGYTFSFNTDTTFIKNTTSDEVLVDLGLQNLLYNGKFNLYPLVNTIGDNFEIIPIALNSDDVTIDNNNIYVFVQEDTQSLWEEWSRVDSLYASDSLSKNFEVRFNENQRYEIKFGNGILGKKPTAGSSVRIVYLASDGSAGQADKGALDGATLFLLNDPEFVQIQEDINAVSANNSVATITPVMGSQITFTNINGSSLFNDRESITSIKLNATNTFKSQNRLVTATDYKNALISKFSNIISSIDVINNAEYTGQLGHIAYLKSLGLTSATDDSRVLSNRIQFATGTGFNNVYVYAVPRFNSTLNASNRPLYLSNNQKNFIINSLNPLKTLTTEIVFMDPVYMAFDIGISNNNINTDSPAQLIITKNPNSFVNNSIIIDQVYDAINQFFDSNNNTLGQYIDLSIITNNILNINGVKSIQTKYGSSIYNGLSFIMWDSIYPVNAKIIQQNESLDKFKFPYFNRLDLLKNKIVVQ